MINTKASTIVSYAVLLIGSAIVLYPLAGVLLASFHPSGSLVSSPSIPSSWNLSNYVEAWEVARFSTYMKSSVIVTTSVVLLAVTLSVLAGYAFAILEFPGRNAIFYLFLIGLIIPMQSTIVPLYFEFRAVGLTNSYWALILPQCGALLAFGALWMRTYFLSAPSELVEAAQVDGAGSWVVLWRVLVPLGRPAILTLALLVALWTWNDFLLPLVMVTDESLRTAPLGLAFFSGQYSTDFPLLASAAVTISAPIVILYVLLQRNFIQGITSGAVKS